MGTEIGIGISPCFSKGIASINYSSFGTPVAIFNADYGIVADGNSKVVTWNPEYGSTTYSFGQAVTASRPLLTTRSDGKAEISFDGIDDYLDSGTLASKLVGGNTAAGNYTIVIHGKLAQTSGYVRSAAVSPTFDSSNANDSLFYHQSTSNEGSHPVNSGAKTGASYYGSWTNVYCKTNQELAFTSITSAKWNGTNFDIFTLHDGKYNYTPGPTSLTSSNTHFLLGTNNTTTYCKCTISAVWVFSSGEYSDKNLKSLQDAVELKYPRIPDINRPDSMGQLVAYWNSNYGINKAGQDVISWNSKYGANDTTFTLSSVNYGIREITDVSGKTAIYMPEMHMICDAVAAKFTAGSDVGIVINYGIKNPVQNTYMYCLQDEANNRISTIFNYSDNLYRTGNLIEGTFYQNDLQQSTASANSAVFGHYKANKVNNHYNNDITLINTFTSSTNYTTAMTQFVIGGFNNAGGYAFSNKNYYEISVYKYIDNEAAFKAIMRNSLTRYPSSTI